MKLRTCRVSTTNEMGLTFCHCKACFHWSVQPLSPPKAGYFGHEESDPLSLVGCLKGAVFGEPASQNGQLNKNDLSLKSFGHFSQLAAIDTVSAVVNRIKIFVFFSNGAMLRFFSFEKAVVGQEESGEEPPSVIDCCLLFQ